MPFDQPPKAIEPPVASVLGVMYVTGWCVSDNDIHASVEPDTGCQPPYSPAHFTFGILVYSPIIPPGSLQSQYPQALMFDDPGVEIDASDRCRVSQPDIMIAADIVDRNRKAVGQTGQVLRRQITARRRPNMGEILHGGHRPEIDRPTAIAHQVQVSPPIRNALVPREAQGVESQRLSPSTQT